MDSYAEEVFELDHILTYAKLISMIKYNTYKKSDLNKAMKKQRHNLI